MNKTTRQRIELLTPLLKDPDMDVRKTAASSIEKLEAVCDCEQIFEILKTGDTGARVAAIYALGKIGGEKVIAPLIYCAGRPEDDIRAAAIEALGIMAVPSTIETILARLDDGNSAVQAKAITALSHFPMSQKICSVLRPFLEANDGMLEAEAALTLAKLNDITAFTGISALLLSPHASTRIAAAEALSILPV